MLEELKDRLRITWSDEDTSLNKLLLSSTAYLEDLAGSSLDVEKNLIARELVLERCRYVYNNAADEFIKNFADDLLRLRLKVAALLRSEANADV
jgi:hypothetical protein